MGVCGVVVIGGAVYGVSQAGLGDALSEDIRPYHEVSNAERATYMQSIVGEFTEAFDTYIIQTETYDYVGHSTFSTQPDSGLFDEVVSPEKAVPKKELAEIKKRMNPDDFCAQEEMMLFTTKGWQYRFKLKNKDGRTIATVICHPSQNAGSV